MIPYPINLDHHQDQVSNLSKTLSMPQHHNLSPQFILSNITISLQTLYYLLL